jgi:hypothetical protein
MTSPRTRATLVAVLLLLGVLTLALTQWLPGSDTNRGPSEPPAAPPIVAPDEVPVAIEEHAPARAVATTDLEEPAAPAPQAPRFHGRAVDDADGRPVAGAFVRAWADATPAGGPATTDADGRFALELAGTDSLPARLEASGYAPLLFAADQEHTDPEAPAELRLRRGSGLLARVLAATGGVLPEVEVVLRADAAALARADGRLANPFLLDDAEFRAETDALGEARFADLPAGVALRVELRSGGRTLKKPGQPLLLAPGEDAEHEFVVGAGATVLGRVVDEAGAPVAGAEVWRLRGVAGMVAMLRPDQRSSVLQKATTDDTGVFEMADVPVGTWWIGVAPGDELAGDAATLAVTPSTFFPEVELVVHRGLFLRGTVVGPDGPVPFAQVLARQRDGRLVDVEGFARDGAFSLGPLVPGTYRVGAGAADLVGPDVVAEAGDDDVVITLTAGLVLRGRVVDAVTGEPTRASVQVQRTSAEHTFGSIGRPPEAGPDFEFDRLEPAQYGLVARTADGRVAVLRALAEPRTSATVHELAVAPGATLQLVVPAGARSGFATIWQDDAMVFGNGLRPGATLDVTVPTGELLLVWKPSGGEPTRRSVAGAAGERVLVELASD